MEIEIYTKHWRDKLLLEKIKELKLHQKHSKFQVGQTISFLTGIDRDTRIVTKITGFSKDGKEIFVLWDCYWYGIQDDETRQIQIIN